MSNILMGDEKIKLEKERLSESFNDSREIEINEHQQHNIIERQSTGEIHTNLIKAVNDRHDLIRESKPDEIVIKSKARKEVNRQQLYKERGIGFSLDNVKITERDSADMIRLKKALKLYLETKKEIIEKRKTVDPDHLSHMQDNEEEYRSRQLIFNGDNLGKMGLINSVDRDRLGPMWQEVMDAIDSYTSFKFSIFKRGEAKARLKQVKELKKQMDVENENYLLSKRRRILVEQDGEVAVKGSYPTLLGARLALDKMKLRNGQWKHHKLANFGYLLKAPIVATTATVLDRLPAIPVMIGVNALRFACKVAKMPLRALSGITNGVLKLFGSKRRWEIGSSLKKDWSKDWTSYADARHVVRTFVKRAIAMPTGWLLAPVHALVTQQSVSESYKQYVDMFKHTGSEIKDGFMTLINELGHYRKNYEAEKAEMDELRRDEAMDRLDEDYEE